MQIIKFANKVNGILHDGFEIAVGNCDLRDVQNNKFKATLISKHEVMVQLPSLDHTFLHEPNFANLAMNQQHTTDNGQIERIQEAFDVERNKILKHERLTKNLLLRFPEVYWLSNDLYAALGDDKKKIRLLAVFYKAHYNINGQKNSSTTARVSWKVSIDEPDKRVTTASSTINEGAALLVAQLSSMYI